MNDFWSRFSGVDYLNIISCIFTVLALVFTLYFWLLDKLSDDEQKFIENKKAFLKDFEDCLKALNDTPDLKTIRDNIRLANERLEVVVNYRFWGRNSANEDYLKIQRFYQDSRYLLSTIRRAIDNSSVEKEDTSLASISSPNTDEMDVILNDYRKGLQYVIDFVENWQ